MKTTRKNETSKWKHLPPKEWYSPRQYVPKNEAPMVWGLALDKRHGLLYQIANKTRSKRWSPCLLWSNVTESESWRQAVQGLLRHAIKLGVNSLPWYYFFGSFLSSSLYVIMTKSFRHVSCLLCPIIRASGLWVALWRGVRVSLVLSLSIQFVHII